MSKDFGNLFNSSFNNDDDENGLLANALISTRIFLLSKIVPIWQIWLTL